MADNWCKAALRPLLLERQRGVAQLCQASTLPLRSAHALLTIIKKGHGKDKVAVQQASSTK